MEISYKRRILHGKIDILRAELVNRLRKKDESGELVITGADVQQLTDILAGRVPAEPRTGAEPTSVALHCPECGFTNGDGANYCQRCGAFLGAARAARRPTPRPTRSVTPGSSRRSSWRMSSPEEPRS